MLPPLFHTQIVDNLHVLFTCKLLSIPQNLEE